MLLPHRSSFERIPGPGERVSPHTIVAVWKMEVGWQWHAH